jgi:methylglutaconyl-CoA hydratase
MRAPLVVSLVDGILTATLARPEKKNALNRALIEGLHEAVDRADQDPAVKVLLLAAAGADFCSGADLGELLESAERTPGENEREALRLGELFVRFRRLPRPVVAVVRGRALAGGAGLATACDIVLAAESATFGYPEIQRGFVPAMVMTMLRRVSGEKAAFDLVATGKVVGAVEAERLGLVSRVVADSALDAEAAALCGLLARQSASAFALTKQLFYELDDHSFGEGIRLGARINALARSTPDFRATIAQFLQKQ